MQHSCYHVDEHSDDELRMCLDALRIGKAPGCDDVPIEAYRGSEEATKELFRICRLMWNTERIPANLVRGMFVMIHKKGSRNDYGNYRAICLLCHSYKLMSAVVARRLMETLEGHLPDTEAGFRPARGRGPCGGRIRRKGTKNNYCSSHLCGSHWSGSHKTG